MRLSYILTFILLCTLGCGNSTPKPNISPTNTETKNSPPNPFANATTFKQKKVEAKIASWEDVQKFVKLQTGKIVVIDIWSTWCEPCMREYPHLVTLQKKYPKQVVCLSFNLNYDGLEDSPPESSKEEIMEFLVKQDSQLTNIISNIAGDDFYDANNLGSVPVVYVYNTDGTVNKIFQDGKEYGQEGFSYKKHITPLVDKLVLELKNKSKN